jgi:undecaprenyl-diphosphatase
MSLPGSEVDMTLLAIIALAVIQGLAELLPVSSSAHVIVAEKLLGLDPTAPEMTLLLVMLHTGTMFAVIAYFWPAWRRTFFASPAMLKRVVALLVLSTALTAAVGYPAMWIIKRTALRASPGADIELIFGNLGLMSAALAAAGLLILWSGLRRRTAHEEGALPDWRAAGWIGAVQGLCLPFRGFSRSGATISTGLLLGVGKRASEEYSFALAVVLTPPVVLREAMRLVDARRESGVPLLHLFAPGLVGMALSFLAGLAALAWLSRWLEHGAWYRFGVYCLAASATVLGLHLAGY